MKETSILYPIIDPNIWAKRYNLNIESRPCLNCGKLITPDVPFAYSGWRGLTSKPHECGEKYCLTVAAPANQIDRQKLIDYFFVVKQTLDT